MEFWVTWQVMHGRLLLVFICIPIVLLVVLVGQCHFLQCSFHPEGDWCVDYLVYKHCLEVMLIPFQLLNCKTKH